MNREQEIDTLDRKIIDLITERAKLYIEELKGRKEESTSVYSPLDRIKVFELIEAFNSGPITNDIYKKIFNELISNSLAVVQPVSVAFLGPIGTFTQIALLEIFGESVETFPQKTISDVFHEVEMGRVSLGVVPVENSTEGAVTYTLDELLDTDLGIVSEKFLRISYSLLSLCSDIKDVRKLYTHPQPLAQCKTWLRRNLPDVEVHQVNSTALAAETASWDKYSAALASDISGKIYNLNVLATHIEDSKQNYTRFLVIGKKDNAPTGNDKTSIVCAVKDKPGALYNLIKPFFESGINMTKIESRPDKKKMWEYNFFIDFKGHRDDSEVKVVLDKIKGETLFLKILGSYPVGN